MYFGLSQIDIYFILFIFTNAKAGSGNFEFES